MYLNKKELEMDNFMVFAIHQITLVSLEFVMITILFLKE